MNRNLLIAAGVFLAIVAAGLFLIKKPAVAPATNNMPVPQSTVEEKVVTDESGPVTEITVTGNEYSYNPAAITVKSGEKVKLTFINSGTSIHDLRIDELDLKTKMVAPGKSDVIEFTAEEAGDITFYCSVSNHQDLGMEGQIKIEP